MFLIFEKGFAPKLRYWGGGSGIPAGGKDITTLCTYPLSRLCPRILSELWPISNSLRPFPKNCQNAPDCLAHAADDQGMLTHRPTACIFALLAATLEFYFRCHMRMNGGGDRCSSIHASEEEKQPGISLTMAGVSYSLKRLVLAPKKRQGQYCMADICASALKKRSAGGLLFG